MLNSFCVVQHLEQGCLKRIDAQRHGKEIGDDVCALEALYPPAK